MSKTMSFIFRMVVGATAAATLPSAAAAADAVPVVTPYRSALTGVRYYQRCDKDPLSNEQAVGRVYWYLQCYPDRLKVDIETLEDATYDPATAVEEYFTYLMFEKNDAGEWVPKGNRVMYPIFEKTEEDLWKAPTDKTAPCIPIPEGYKWMLSCRSSCYKPEMSLWFPEGKVPIKDAYDRGIDQVVVLSESATLDHPAYTTQKVASYTASDKAKAHDIVSIRTQAGGNLKVTTNHPLIDELGYVREAATFHIGDALVRQDGLPDLIVDVQHEDYFGKVYNILPDTESTLGNVVVAEGFLSGSEWYQNEASDLLNSALLRANIPADAL